MICHRPSCFVVSVLIAGQIFGPVGLWAAEQRGARIHANRSMLVSALDGEYLAMQGSDGDKRLRFRDVVNMGEPITTAEDTVAEILVSNRAVVSLAPRTKLQFTTITDDQTALQLSQGSVRVAAASSGVGEGGLITIQTPSGQVQTRGGIVHVQVQGGSIASGEHLNAQPRPYLVAYSPDHLAAASELQAGLIHVEEGLAEVLGAGPDGTALAVPAGTTIKLLDGRAENISGSANQSTPPKILASVAHNTTPKEGIENLVALQINQATALGKALTGAPETGNAVSGNKDESKNVINGATGGVALANSGLVTQLFGSAFGAGNSSIVNSAGSAVNETGSSYGLNNNNGFRSTPFTSVKTGWNGEQEALLIFTEKTPVQSYVKEGVKIGEPKFPGGSICGGDCLLHFRDTIMDKEFTNVEFRPLESVRSDFRVRKELVLIGGVNNTGHGGQAPNSTLMVRGIGPTATPTNVEIFGTDRFPASIDLFGPAPGPIVQQNSTFVAEVPSELPENSLTKTGIAGVPKPGTGTLAQFSNRADGTIFGSTATGEGFLVDGAITATGANVKLTGGVVLDRGTIATIGTTEATNKYFSGLNSQDAKYSGSLLSVINGPNGPTSLTINNRVLGVYDGSRVQMEGNDKALLSVLDARLKGPSSVPLIDIDAAFLEDGNTQGAKPDVTVASAVVTRSSIPLDGALLEASAPLLALTNATMTTTSHFADLAGNRNQSLVLGDALVALRAASLTVNGNLLNLNAASATVGYLFSLTGSSTLTINGGTLFNLANGSSLNINANAFGAFGSGTNTLAVSNNLCVSTCGLLVNSSNQPFLINGSTPLKVAGVTQNVVLPNNFNVFAVAPNASLPNVKITATDALFKVDSTSTLKIRDTTVVTK